MFFEKFEYRQDPLTKLYGVAFPRHHEQMLLDCILIVEKECEHYITWTTQKYGSDVQPLKKALSTITPGKLANLIVDCIDTIRAKNNWNSHGAALGSAMCQVSSIISSLGKASEEDILVINMETLTQFLQNTWWAHMRAELLLVEMKYIWMQKDSTNIIMLT